jgi:hypothetical protein
LSFIKREDVVLSLFPHSKVLEILFSEQMELTAARDPLLTRGTSLTDVSKPETESQQTPTTDFYLIAIPAKQLAKQMTCIEFSYFNSIKFDEFLGQAWNKKGSEWKAPNILSCIKRFNELSAWVTQQILTADKKSRHKVIQKFIHVAKVIIVSISFDI